MELKLGLKIRFLAAEDDFKEAERGEKHNQPGDENPGGNGDHSLFEVEIQDAGGEGAGPGAGAGNRDGDKEKESEIGAAFAGFLQEFFAAFLAFFEAEITKLLEGFPFFLAAPLEKFASKQINDRDWEDVADDGGDEDGPLGEAEVHTDRYGDGAAEFDQRNHRDKQN